MQRKIRNAVRGERTGEKAVGFKGPASGKFDPGGATTRGMIVTTLYRLEGEPTVPQFAITEVEAGR